MSDSGRWPRWVYDAGEEPDYRFSFANERTFLAWIRTALALIACGVAVDALDLEMPGDSQSAVALTAVLLGFACAPVAWLRWARSEAALRRARPLPGGGVLALVAAVLSVSTLVIVAVAL